MKDVHGTRAALVAIGLALGWAEFCPAASNLSPIVSFVVPTDRPTAAEVDGIVGNLHAHGFGQFMIYPGDGLGYDYLGEDYFKMVGAFLEGARRRGSGWADAISARAAAGESGALRPSQ